MANKVYSGRDYAKRKLEQVYPVVLKWLTHLGTLMLILTMVWLDSTLRGIDSFFRMGITSFFSVIWFSIISIIGMIGVTKFLITLAIAALMGIFVGLTVGLLIVATCGLVFLWSYGSFWTTAFVVVIGGLAFMFSRQRITLLIPTAYCAWTYSGWLGLLLAFSLSFISSDVLTYFVKNNIDQQSRSNSPFEQSEGMDGPAGFADDDPYPSPFSEAGSGSAADRSSGIPSTSGMDAELTSEDEIVRLLNCNDHYSVWGMRRYEDVDVTLLKREYRKKVLNGDRLVSCLYKLDFKNDKDLQLVCQKKLTKQQVAKLRFAVDKDYYFQMYYDDLPIWGFIGKIDRENKADPSEVNYFLYKHIQFSVQYNKDRVIEMSAQMDPHSLLGLTEDKELDAEFLYSVKWKEAETPFEKRMQKYSPSSSLPRHLEIHWFSIINSCVTVLLLTGFRATILMRGLKNDFMKYAQAADDLEVTGWKYIHGDVFRYPKYKSLFSAAIGSGTQLFTLAVFIFILALVCVFYPYSRGALFTALVVIYALTSWIYCHVLLSPARRKELGTFNFIAISFCFLKTMK